MTGYNICIYNHDNVPYMSVASHHFISDRFTFRSKRISLLVFIYVDLFVQLTIHASLQYETFTRNNIIRDYLCMHKLHTFQISLPENSMFSTVNSPNIPR